MARRPSRLSAHPSRRARAGRQTAARRRLLCSALGLATVALCAGCGGEAPLRPPEVAEQTRRGLPQGEVVGSVSPEGAFVWRGIPYARPPVGPLRWRAPQPPDPWPGVLEALQHGSPCVQLGGPMTEGPDEEPAGDEDCLFVNVYAPPPEHADGAPRLRPVMVWIHGGGNTVGSADPYDGSTLATRENVVVVTLNYRLGIFGWLAHPALRSGVESTADRSGNYGTLDLVRALEWVRDEIHHFGGDPARVTVFGESAGGVNVYTLLLSPRAKGLFHRAIVQSGALRSVSVAEAENARDDSPPGHARSSTELLLDLLEQEGRAADRAGAREILAAMSPDEVAAYLRAQPAPRLLGLFEGGSFGGMYDAPLPIRDGFVLPTADPLEQLASGAWNRVPVITGTNRDETKLFAAFGSPHVLRVFGLPVWLRDARLYTLHTTYSSLMWKATAVDEPAEAMTRAESGLVYAYRFDWDEEPRVLFTDLGEIFGAAHGLEIPFVFGRLSFFGRDELIFDPDRRPAAEALSQAMTAYWGEFARSGAPGRGTEGDQPAWRPWSTSPGIASLLLLDTEADGGIRMARERITRRAVVSRVASDERFEDMAERCAVYAEMAQREMGLTRDDYRNVAGGGCRDFPL